MSAREAGVVRCHARINTMSGHGTSLPVVLARRIVVGWFFYALYVRLRSSKRKSPLTLFYLLSTRRGCCTGLARCGLSRHIRSADMT